MPQQHPVDGTPPPSFNPTARAPRPRLSQGIPAVSETPIQPGDSESPTPNAGDGDPQGAQGPGAIPQRRSVFGAQSDGQAQPPPSIPPTVPPASLAPTSQGQAKQLPPAYAPRQAAGTQGTDTAKAAAQRPVRRSPQGQPCAKQPPVTSWTAPASQQTVGQGRGSQRPPTKRRKSKRRWSRRRTLTTSIAILLVLILAWPTWLMWHTNRSMHRVDVLSGASGTPGTTYLFAGSDSRDGWITEDPSDVGRTDSVILVNRAPNGQASMISMPRDLYVNIPGVGMSKLNAAFAYGGPSLLVETLENLTGLTIDHYVEIGMGGVSEIVEAMGGVTLCYDADVFDPYSGMDWTAGCHLTNGEEALAFSRMRYEDPLGDIGRTLRQRQLLGAVANKALSPKVLLNPVEQLRLADAAADALTVDQRTNAWNVGQLLLAMRKASQNELTGQPPISSMGEMTEAGLVMILDAQRAPAFFEKVAAGTLTPADFELNL